MKTDAVMIILSVSTVMIYALAEAKKPPQTISPKTFTDIIIEHPMPNLEDLAERSKPSILDPNITQVSFYDLLKLRTVGTAKAVPILEQVTKDDNYTGRIHSFAAAQALFCIDTPQAHAALKRYIFDDRYNTQLGINYTFHWEMAEPQRSAFIERYHVNNRSETLKIDLAANSETLNAIHTITATLTNISQKAFRVYDYPFAFGDHLYFRTQDGRFIQRFRMSTRCQWRDEWIELQPGQTKEYQTTMEVLSVDQLHKSFRRYLKGGDIWLKENHSNAFFVENPGEFQVFAMLERAPLSKEHTERLGFDNAWTGRSVSKPMTIVIGPENNL